MTSIINSAMKQGYITKVNQLVNNFLNHQRVLISEDIESFYPWERVKEYTETPAAFNKVKRAAKRVGGLWVKYESIRENPDNLGIDQLVCEVSNKDQTLAFTFYFSHVDSQKIQKGHDSTLDFLTGCLYSILCDFGLNAQSFDSFEDFCVDFGYDSDSRRAEQLFHRCQAHRDMLTDFFTGEELEAMPS